MTKFPSRIIAILLVSSMMAHGALTVVSTPHSPFIRYSTAALVQPFFSEQVVVGSLWRFTSPIDRLFASLRNREAKVCALGLITAGAAVWAASSLDSHHTQGIRLLATASLSTLTIPLSLPIVQKIIWWWIFRDLQRKLQPIRAQIDEFLKNGETKKADELALIASSLVTKWIYHNQHLVIKLLPLTLPVPGDDDEFQTLRIASRPVDILVHFSGGEGAGHIYRSKSPLTVVWMNGNGLAIERFSRTSEENVGLDSWDTSSPISLKSSGLREHTLLSDTDVAPGRRYAYRWKNTTVKPCLSLEFSLDSTEQLEHLIPIEGSPEQYMVWKGPGHQTSRRLHEVWREMAKPVNSHDTLSVIAAALDTGHMLMTPMDTVIVDRVIAETYCRLFNPTISQTPEGNLVVLEERAERQTLLALGLPTVLRLVGSTLEEGLPIRPKLISLAGEFQSLLNEAIQAVMNFQEGIEENDLDALITHMNQISTVLRYPRPSGGNRLYHISSLVLSEIVASQIKHATYLLESRSNLAWPQTVITRLERIAQDMELLARDVQPGDRIPVTMEQGSIKLHLNRRATVLTQQARWAKVYAYMAGFMANWDRARKVMRFAVTPDTTPGKAFGPHNTLNPFPALGITAGLPNLVREDVLRSQTRLRQLVEESPEPFRSALLERLWFVPGKSLHMTYAGLYYGQTLDRSGSVVAQAELRTDQVTQFQKVIHATLGPTTMLDFAVAKEVHPKKPADLEGLNQQNAFGQLLNYPIRFHHVSYVWVRKSINEKKDDEENAFEKALTAYFLGLVEQVRNEEESIPDGDKPFIIDSLGVELSTDFEHSEVTHRASLLPDLDYEKALDKGYEKLRTIIGVAKVHHLNRMEYQSLLNALSHSFGPLHMKDPDALAVAVGLNAISEEAIRAKLERMTHLEIRITDSWGNVDNNKVHWRVAGLADRPGLLLNMVETVDQMGACVTSINQLGVQEEDEVLGFPTDSIVHGKELPSMQPARFAINLTIEGVSIKRSDDIARAYTHIPGIKGSVRGTTTPFDLEIADVPNEPGRQKRILETISNQGPTINIHTYVYLGEGKSHAPLRMQLDLPPGIDRTLLEKTILTASGGRKIAQDAATGHTPPMVGPHSFFSGA